MWVCVPIVYKNLSFKSRKICRKQEDFLQCVVYKPGLDQEVKKRPWKRTEYSQ